VSELDPWDRRRDVRISVVFSPDGQMGRKRPALN